MEEVDSIILHFLKQLDIKISDEMKNLCDLPVETIIESASKCLSVINPGQKLPPRLPSGISHRIEVAAQIASICKDLGYKNDVGYQTFLYYNESELRQVFMFLIEHLPSEGTQNITVEPASNKSLLLQDIGRKIEEELNSIWIPPSCNKNNRSIIGDFTSPPDKKSKNWKTVASQFNENDLEQKLSQMNIQIKFSKEAEAKENKIETEAKTEINHSLKELKEMALVLRQNLNVLESERNIIDVEYQQANKSFEKVEAELKYVQDILKNIGIENINSDIVGDNILEKVQQNIEKLHMKSEELTSNNLTIRVEIDKYTSSNASSQSERTRCRKTLITLKDTAKAMKEEYNSKELQRDILKRKYEKLKGGSKRSIYTKRILEIISNVDKQNLEISKVLEDTRQIQKEINSLEGQLDRCFSIADETLFADAKKDDQAKKAYKLLALLHSECNTIVSLVNETGALAREIVDLEDNIKAEKTKRTEDTLEKIQSDLAKMQEESNKI